MDKKRVCGARCKRTGEACQNRPTTASLSGRCRLHGGSPRQPRGIGHYRYKHGRRSRDPIARMIAQQQAQAEARAEGWPAPEIPTPAPTPAPEVHPAILNNVAQGKADWIEDLERAARGNVTHVSDVSPSDQGKADWIADMGRAVRDNDDGAVNVIPADQAQATKAQAKEEVGRAESRV